MTATMVFHAPKAGDQQITWDPVDGIGWYQIVGWPDGHPEQKMYYNVPAGVTAFACKAGYRYGGWAVPAAQWAAEILVPAAAPAPTPTPAPSPSHDWFSASSPWNTRRDPSRTLKDDASAALMRQGSFYFNARNGYGIPIYYAQATDPVVNWSSSDSPTVSFHAPVGLQAAGGTDKHLAIIDPTRSFVDEAWGAVPSGTGWHSDSHERISLSGDGMSGGMRAADWSILGGCILKKELDAGVINHALALCINVSMAAKRFVPPARSIDYNTGGYRQDGSGIPMGTYFSIDSSVDLGAQGLSRDGLTLARAVQTYGAYVADTGGQHCFFGEPAVTQSQVDAIVNDLGRIRALLRTG